MSELESLDGPLFRPVSEGRVAWWTGSVCIILTAQGRTQILEKPDYSDDGTCDVPPE